MSFGEMTILLHDVQHIHQLPFDGQLMALSWSECDQAEVNLCELMGFNSEQMHVGHQRHFLGYTDNFMWPVEQGLRGLLVVSHFNCVGSTIVSHFEAQSLGQDIPWATRWTRLPSPGFLTDPSVRLVYTVKL
ncbi:unnamed protein product [Linum tenue]|uniref:Uncharacterized protein n=1 Tax=Linum tenue TaxID=586396 RepID=A0AAV0HA14_9ROSI|nr:unnamed protein product [Linum tenue]